MTGSRGTTRGCLVCGGPPLCRSLCAYHYRRWRSAGRPGQAAWAAAERAPPPRHCPLCGEPLPAGGSLRPSAYCSRRCREWARAGLTAPPGRRCAGCGGPFEPGRGPERYCSAACRLAPARPRGGDGRCRRCGGPLPPGAHGNARFCGDGCRRAWARDYGNAHTRRRRERGATRH